MASTKKGSKKGSKGGKKSSSSKKAAGTTTTAVSTAPAATQPDPKKEAMFACIQAAFSEQGLGPITSPLNQIVWSSIPESVIVKIAVSIRKCIKSKLGIDTGDLSAVMVVLAANMPVMTVAALIDALEPLVKP